VFFFFFFSRYKSLFGKIDNTTNYFPIKVWPQYGED